MHLQSLHGSLWHFRAASCQRDNRSRTLQWHACRLTTCHQRRAYKRIRLNTDCPSAAASLLPEGDSADDKVLLLWDLDNISPPGGAAGVALWAHGLQHAVAQLGGEMCGFDVVANPATLQKVPGVPTGLVGTGARLVEATCRPEAADMLITSTAVAFAQAHGCQGRIAVVSNDAGFAALLAYLATLGCKTVTIGTWHRQKRFTARPLGWRRHPLAQAADTFVLWKCTEPVAEPNFRRSKPDRIWRRQYAIGDVDDALATSAVPYSIWHRSGAAAVSAACR